MRSKVILLALKYMVKMFLTTTLSIGLFLLVGFKIGELVNDPELGFIICFGTLAFFGIFATCYDVAKNKLDYENRELLEKIARKQ